MKLVGIKLSTEQIKAVEAAFTDSSDLTMSDKLRALIAEALALRGIALPATPPLGGKRPGAGRPRKS